MSAAPVFGAVCWGQYTTWDPLLEAARAVDRLGYGSLWCTDHLQSIHGTSPGPIFEGWGTLAAWATATNRVRLGLLVAANTFRVPGLTAKLATTLDHLSGGRAVLGVGAGWHEAEHRAFGLSFGSSPGERLRWLDEALAIMRASLDGEAAPAPGPRYRGSGAWSRPLPVQAHLPILVGGGGEQTTLRLVAKWADMSNFGGTVDAVRRKEDALLRHCESLGRDPREIERTLSVGIVVIRGRREEADDAYASILGHNGNAQIAAQTVGTPESLAEQLAPYVELGYRHLIAEFPAPFDHESIERLVNEVGPLLA